jgi:hypothetical protein
MTAKQLTVMWLMILLIAAQFYFGGQFETLFGMLKASNSTSAPIYGPTGSGVNISNGIPMQNGKCPKGYIAAFGKCWSPAEDPKPPTGGTTA